jgi:hypothetical protein
MAFDFEPAVSAIEALGDGRGLLLDSQVACRYSERGIFAGTYL